MAAIEEPDTHLLTIRDAAEACGVSTRTIRRRLASGAFPRAFKLSVPDSGGEGVWRIPLTDLYRSGLVAVEKPLSSAAGSAPPVQLSTRSELMSSDRFGRLRSELAEAVAAAEILLIRAEADKWRAIAEERGQALDRADLALRTVSAAVEAGSREESLPTLEPAPTAGAVAEIPSSVRDEALRYTSALQANRHVRAPRRWWHRGR